MVLQMIVFLVPLALWLAAAPPGRVRTTVAAVLVAGALLAGAAAQEWLPVGISNTAGLLGWCVLAAAPLVGLKLAGPLRTGKGGGRRFFVAAWMAGLSVLVGGATCVYGLLLLGNGPRARVPDASVLPTMPAGLRITTDRDNGCGGNSSWYCSRILVVTGAPDQDAAQVLDRLRGRLTAADWPMAQRDPGVWTGCRTRGLLLDADEVCASLTLSGGAVTVDLSTGDSW
ncbi:hypothetical protein [Kitasatospora sp. NPDC004531]